VAARVRHHVDVEQGVIRVLWITRDYLSLRQENLAILQITAPDDGQRCRVTLERAFAVGRDPAATCLELCRAAADTPGVGIEFDAGVDNLRMVVEAAVEDGELTQRQLAVMIGSLAEAAERWSGMVGRSVPGTTDAGGRAA
jgi:hypothetical protein